MVFEDVGCDVLGWDAYMVVSVKEEPVVPIEVETVCLYKIVTTV